MALDASPSRKRKRDIQHNDKVTLSMSTAFSTVGPVIAAFPAIQPEQSTPFKCYVKRKKNAGDATTQGPNSQEAIMVGETDSVEFHSGSVGATGSSCQYLIGIRDKKTNRVILRPAGLHVLSRDIKAFKSLDPLAVSQDERSKARNELGEAFGSKKAKLAIKAMERNRVDVSAMEGVAGHLQDSIDAGTGSLPSLEAAKAAADESRPIPRYNVQAKSPDQIYALHDIVSEAELNSISVSRLIHASDENGRLACLPFQRSSWINQHIKFEFESSAKPSKNNLKILFYISSMFLFRMSSSSVRDKTKLQQRMSMVPNEIIDGLLSRFTERSRESTTAQTTKGAETLLLTHMFALCLRVDRYATDPALLASDLSMTVANVTKHFKQLGCKVEVLSSAQRTELGLGPTADKDAKLCILRVPFDFPKQRIMRKRQ
ncbi:RNA polymerase I associated factor, A49-like protein [Hysterangium stoloniferum]|nr:RNA polymerase I associated factor, A49-like protein [Hysterangium stoloniferum]